MADNKKIVTGIAITAVILAVIIIVWLAVRKKKPGIDVAVSPTPAPVPGGVTGSAYPIQQGSNGPAVEQWQKNINYLLYWAKQYGKNTNNTAPLTVDGNWGPKTQSAFILANQLAGRAPVDTAILSKSNSDDIAAAYNKAISQWRGTQTPGEGIADTPPVDDSGFNLFLPNTWF